MTQKVQVLLIGAAEEIYADIQDEWKKQNIGCHAAHHLSQALPDIAARQYHLIAIFVSHSSKHDVLRQIALIRGMSTMPILISTDQLFSPSLRIQILNAGADQFHGFPIIVEEWISIANALIRRYLELNRKDEPPTTVILRKHIVVAVEQRVVFVEIQRVELLSKEFDILCLLILYPGYWYTHEQIYEKVWRDTPGENTKEVVRKQVYNLRGKLQISPELPDLIHSQRGTGYCFTPIFGVS